jgi:hypothetical protein
MTCAINNKYGFVDLLEVEPRNNYTLLLTFETGEKKIFDFKPKLQQELYRPLKDINLFMKAHNAGFGVIWNDTIDIAAEPLYYNGTPVEEVVVSGA